jgi:uncharacterized MAPEG superfamily protein
MGVAWEEPVTALEILVWCCLLAFAQMLIAVLGAMMQVGLPPLAGNREGLPEITGWAGRARRAHYNMLESLLLFAVLVLVAQALGKAGSSMVLLGAQLFLIGRIAHAVVYIAGIPWLRTAVWLVAVVGLALVFLGVLR